jgi:murein L,D-transpeptidase YcbB/YkuD
MRFPDRFVVPLNRVLAMRRIPVLIVFGILVLTLLPLSAISQPGDEQAGIRRFLEGLDAGDVPVVDGRRLNEPELLARVYREREHTPLWLPGGPLFAGTGELLTAIDQSAGHGFAVERYHRSSIEGLLDEDGRPVGLAAELLLTDALLSQLLHRGRGAVLPPNLDAEWQLPQAHVDPEVVVGQLARGERGVIEALDALWPAHREYLQLLQRRAEITALGDEVAVQVPPGPLIRPGHANDRVLLLKRRLMGPGEYSPVYDDELRREVMAFQGAAGLEPDGIVGDHTLEVLNATRVSWIDRIDANLERWRWLPREAPTTYIRVNIAAFTLRAFEDGQPVLGMNVIVGLPYRRTPVFSETVKYLVLNPYWNVPFSIATRDKLPLLKADQAQEAAKGFEAKAHGSDRFIAVDAVDWSGVTRGNFNFLLRQRPGPANALGRIKFMLPNPFSVYLHDTPSRELFSRQERSFSSGCIRLEQPVVLAEWLLSREGHAAAGRVETMLSGGETSTLYLKQPVPAYVVYFTAFTDDQGEVVFRRDVYGRDRVLIEALREQRS